MAPRSRRGLKTLTLVICVVLATAALVAGCGSEQTTSVAGTDGAASPVPSGPTTRERHERAAIAKEEAASADQSIQEFGEEASAEERGSVVAAMRSFLGALARADYTAVCDRLTAENRRQLLEYAKFGNGDLKGCEGVARELLVPAAIAEAAKAVKGTISRVRVDGDTAFILFRPVGGKVSYLVLERDGSAWKATSLAPGTPLVP